MPPQTRQTATDAASGISQKVGPTIENALSELPKTPKAPHIQGNMDDSNMKVI
jgi:hypothetical protein